MVWMSILPGQKISWYSKAIEILDTVTNDNNQMHEVDKKTMNPESDRMRSTRHL